MVLKEAEFGKEQKKINGGTLGKAL